MHHLTISSPAHYQITLLGSLDENWSSRFGMVVRVRRGVDNIPITTLTGEVVDQGMLHGVLNYVYDLGMPILKVEYLDSDSGWMNRADQPDASELKRSPAWILAPMKRDLRTTF